MFDISQYRELAPCLFEDNIRKSMKTLISDLPEFGRFLSGVDGSRILADYMKVGSWVDFHRIALFEDLVPGLLESSSDGFEVEGIDNVESGKSYLFISNHRDTVLDCTLLGYALLNAGKNHVQPVLGSNLTDIGMIEPYLVLCGGVVVNRNLEMRELYKQSMLLSHYISDAISSGYSSVWIAGGAGRSKDGVDNVKSSVLKMIMLGKDRSETLSDYLGRIRIVPVSISYEYDPSDVIKAYATANEHGNYVKTKKEDLFSILKSLRQNKGRICISLSKPVEPDFDDVEVLAKSIQDTIISNYKLFPINYYAYDKVNGSAEYADKYDSDSMSGFFDKTRHLSEKVRMCHLNYYANPVLSARNLKKGS